MDLSAQAPLAVGAPVETSDNQGNTFTMFNHSTHQMPAAATVPPPRWMENTWADEATFPSPCGFNPHFPSGKMAAALPALCSLLHCGVTMTLLSFLHFPCFWSTPGGWTFFLVLAFTRSHALSPDCFEFPEKRLTTCDVACILSTFPWRAVL